MDIRYLDVKNMLHNNRTGVLVIVLSKAAYVIDAE